MNKIKARRHKNKLFKRVIFTILTIVFVFIMSFLLVVLALGIVGNDSKIGFNNNSIGDMIMDTVFPPIRERTNVIILGTDEGSLTDTIMVASFNSITGRLDIISIPRDTRVTMHPERVNSIQASGRFVPQGGIMKFGEIHSYAGTNMGMEYAMLEAQELLGIELHYYVRVNLEALRFVVDSIGGVGFDVPQRMYYHDPVQDLFIDLQPGWQVLDGNQAEGLVRFRGYREADIQRIRVQQDFVIAMIKQVLSSQNMINNATTLISAVLNYVYTNFPFEDIPKYLRYVNLLNQDNIHFHIMPHTPRYIGGISYAIADDDAINTMVNDILFFSNTQNSENSFDKRIQVLNGSDTVGAAAQGRDILISNGYQVLNIGNYEGAREVQTRIFVRTPGTGEDISALFPGSRIVLDSNMDDNYDIIVVLGMG